MSWPLSTEAHASQGGHWVCSLAGDCGQPDRHIGRTSSERLMAAVNTYHPSLLCSWGAHDPNGLISCFYSRQRDQSGGVNGRRSISLMAPALFLHYSHTKPVGTQTRDSKGSFQTPLIIAAQLAHHLMRSWVKVKLIKNDLKDCFLFFSESTVFKMCPLVSWSERSEETGGASGPFDGC